MAVNPGKIDNNNSISMETLTTKITSTMNAAEAVHAVEEVVEAHTAVHKCCSISHRIWEIRMAMRIKHAIRKISRVVTTSQKLLSVGEHEAAEHPKYNLEIETPPNIITTRKIKIITIKRRIIN